MITVFSIFQTYAYSRQANGFYGSTGISGRIPEGYTLLEQRFMQAVANAGRLWNPSASNGAGRGVQLSEWEKEGWTYHAKGRLLLLYHSKLDITSGIWVSPNAASPPVLTLFGSTNLNSRSAHIDTELSFIMVIPVPSDQLASESQPSKATQGSETTASDSLAAMMSLRHRLADEIANLRAHAVEWKGRERKVRFWTKIIVGMVKGML
jgi:CDP-diacylglycerol--glycerol-3-phosphate 3-phosphatidyltransferase